MRKAAAPPTARVVDDQARRRARVGWIVALAMIPPGLFLIGHANRWHLTSPVIVLGLAWVALIGAGYTLVRAANAAVDPIADDWFVATGSRDELEREKRNLIRAIKDVEFDRDTGKVTAADADQQIAMYRARAIEVIKAIDASVASTPRERVLAELAARVALARTADKAGKKAKTAKASKPGKPAATEKAAAPAEVARAAAPDAGLAEDGPVEDGRAEEAGDEAAPADASAPDRTDAPDVPAEAAPPRAATAATAPTPTPPTAPTAAPTEEAAP